MLAIIHLDPKPKCKIEMRNSPLYLNNSEALIIHVHASTIDSTIHALTFTQQPGNSFLSSAMNQLAHIGVYRPRQMDLLNFSNLMGIYASVTESIFAIPIHATQILL